jgi:glycosyltransferase involved in cell wall biosynthesis
LRHRIVYVQYTNPAGYPPLEHSSRILAGKGWKVLFLGTGAQGANALEFPPHPNIQVRKMGFCSAGWLQKVHYFGFGLWTVLWVLLWRPKWIYASDPLSCPVALTLNFLPWLRVIYHEHDSPAAKNQNVNVKSESPDLRPSMSSFQRFVMWSRRKLACRASLCVLPNEKRIDHFKEQTGTTRPVVCVWNCPRLEEAEAVAPKVTNGKFIVFYHGSIVPSRLPLTVVEALRHLPGTVILRIAGYETAGHRGYVDMIRSEAVRAGVESRIEFLGAFSRYNLLAQCRQGNVGLSFMPFESADLNMSAMVGASNKPFDYLACGLALLVSDLPDWEKMFVEPGYGLACDPEDPASIAAALGWFIEHAEETRRMGECGRNRILKEWNYEKQFEQLSGMMLY